MLGVSKETDQKWRLKWCNITEKSDLHVYYTDMRSFSVWPLFRSEDQIELHSLHKNRDRGAVGPGGTCPPQIFLKF